MIRVENLSKKYHTDSVETRALHNINLHILRQEFVSIMGPSGCGKSTLLNILGLLDRPTEGAVYVKGQPLISFSDAELSRLRNLTIGFIFQSFHLLSDLRVIENVELPLLYRRGSTPQRRALAQAALEKVGLGGRMQHFPNQLSGGQQQRVAIARAIVGKPEILLADEPTGNLDSKMGAEVMEILLKLNAEGTTIVMVTHDQSIAHRSSRIIRVHDGQLTMPA